MFLNLEIPRYFILAVGKLPPSIRMILLLDVNYYVAIHGWNLVVKQILHQWWTEGQCFVRGQLQLQRKKFVLNPKSKQVNFAWEILHRNRYEVIYGWAIWWVSGRMRVMMD